MNANRAASRSSSTTLNPIPQVASTTKRLGMSGAKRPLAGTTGTNGDDYEDSDEERKAKEARLKEMGKERFKKMKVDLAPALVTKPYSSVGRLGKPFKAPAFVQGTSGPSTVGGAVSSRGCGRSSGDAASRGRGDDTYRSRTGPQHSVVEERTPAKVEPKRKTTVEGTIEIDDSDNEVPVAPRRANVDHSRDHKPASVAMDVDEDDEDDEAELSDAEDVTLLAEYSNKVSVGSSATFLELTILKRSLQLEVRKQGYDMVRQSLYKVFISKGDLWNKLPKAPTSLTDRYVFLAFHSQRD